MRIGIDISQLAFPGTGVSVYTQNLIESLKKLDTENEFIFFFSSLRQKSPVPESKNFKFPPLFLEVLWNRLHVLPVERFIGKIDLFHTSDWLEPPAQCPKVTTIHDLTVLKYPESFSKKGGHDIVENMKRKLEIVKKESKLIIAVSESTKRDIVQLLGIPESRIRVIYEAANDIFNNKLTKDNLENVKEKYGIEGKYILAVGTREPRKNLQRVLEAHDLLISKHPDIQLVIVGKYGWGEDQSSIINNQSSIKLLGYVPREDLPALYSGAEAFVYPSLYEGFGLPVLEAMASGCPVVTSNVSSLPEIAGDGAILVSPQKSDQIRDGIEEAIKNRETLIAKGKKRARDFSWEKTAKETLNVYKEALC